MKTLESHVLRKRARVVRWGAGGKGLLAQYLACGLPNWIVGVSGSRILAEEIRQEIKTFLKERLKLTLSEEKTHITHARSEEAQFLGTTLKIGSGGQAKVALTTNGSGKKFKRRSTGWETVIKAPIPKLLKRLSDRGFCSKTGE